MIDTISSEDYKTAYLKEKELNEQLIEALSLLIGTIEDADCDPNGALCDVIETTDNISKFLNNVEKDRAVSGSL